MKVRIELDTKNPSGTCIISVDGVKQGGIQRVCLDVDTGGINDMRLWRKLRVEGNVRVETFESGRLVVAEGQS